MLCMLQQRVVQDAVLVNYVLRGMYLLGDLQCICGATDGILVVGFLSWLPVNVLWVGLTHAIVRAVICVLFQPWLFSGIRVVVWTVSIAILCLNRCVICLAW